MNRDQLFREVVLSGLACGLATPQEWLRNYLMHLMSMFPYEDIPQTEKLIYEIAQDIYKNIKEGRELDPHEIDIWIWGDETS